MMCTGMYPFVALQVLGLILAWPFLASCCGYRESPGCLSNTPAPSVTARMRGNPSGDDECDY